MASPDQLHAWLDLRVGQSSFGQALVEWCKHCSMYGALLVVYLWCDTPLCRVMCGLCSIRWHLTQHG